MAGYIRQDTVNNIADGNIINASDFDNEYDAIEDAFHAITGHTHDGTAAEGAPITKIGPTQDVVASSSALTPKTDNIVDLGSSALEYKDLWIDGTANIDSLVADTADINAGTIDGVTIGSSTINCSNNTVTVDGTNAVGFRAIPQNSQSTAYTLVLADSGKHILHPSADTTARTFTIPANSSVAFPVGTAITFINQNGAGVVTIAITTDTMRLAGAGITGSRTLAANGVATAIKLTSTEWIISGTGLT